MNKARVENKLGETFSPFQPIQLREFFAGRLEQIRRIDSALRAEGQHVVLFGDRGVGKTSLANIIQFLTDRKCVLHRCNTADGYQAVFSNLLTKLEIPTSLKETTCSYEQQLNAQANVAIAKGDVKTKRTTTEKSHPLYSSSLDPSYVLESISDMNAVLIIDEFDRIQSDTDKMLLADTIKLLSDNGSKCKIVVVGVAGSISELIGAHRSISRSLCQIHLQRMSDDELREILTKGEKKLNITFSEEVKKSIVDLSDGLPYFAQLLAYHAVDDWLRSPNISSTISRQNLSSGLAEAISNASEYLRDCYAKATRTVKSDNERFRNILWACAMAECLEVQVQSILNNVSSLEKREVNIQGCSYHLSQLTASQRGEILTRQSKGWYKFTDPLMRGYVRMQMQYENLLYHEGQLVFPFMQ